MVCRFWFRSDRWAEVVVRSSCYYRLVEVARTVSIWQLNYVQHCALRTAIPPLFVKHEVVIKDKQDDGSRAIAGCGGTKESALVIRGRYTSYERDRILTYRLHADGVVKGGSALIPLVCVSMAVSLNFPFSLQCCASTVGESWCETILSKVTIYRQCSYRTGIQTTNM